MSTLWFRWIHLNHLLMHFNYCYASIHASVSEVNLDVWVTAVDGTQKSKLITLTLVKPYRP